MFGLGLDADHDHRKLERMRERDPSLQHAAAFVAHCRFAHEPRRETNLVEGVLDDVVHIALAVDIAQDDADPELVQRVTRPG